MKLTQKQSMPHHPDSPKRRPLYYDPLVSSTLYLTRRPRDAMYRQNLRKRGRLQKDEKRVDQLAMCDLKGSIEVFHYTAGLEKKKTRRDGLRKKKIRTRTKTKALHRLRLLQSQS